MILESLERIVREAEEQNVRISDVVLRLQAEELERKPELLLEQTEQILRVMEESVAKGMERNTPSPSGLSGGGAVKLAAAQEGGALIDCGVLNRAMAYATAVAEHNACMGRIAAAPTAGSSGILPGVLLSVAERYEKSRDEIVMALVAASGVGMVIAHRANLSGAQGGCQAECGSAAAMAAAAAVELMGGSPVQAADAAAVALKSVMGLICDPVAGLVECPCVKRNASGAANALCAANMALAGMASAIPADEVIDAMRAVGDMMSPALRETSMGGIAVCPTALRIQQELGEGATGAGK